MPRVITPTVSERFTCFYFRLRHYILALIAIDAAFTPMPVYFLSDAIDFDLY